MRVIFIDAGHGKGPSGSPYPLWNDEGSSYKYNGKVITERRTNINVASKILNILKSKEELFSYLIQGVCIETSNTNYNRMKFVNSVIEQNGIDKIYGAKGVSLHCNSSSNKSGCLGYYNDKYPSNKEFVMYILREINRYFGIPIEGVYPASKSRWGNGLYINNAKCPYCLIEMGYIRGDITSLLDYDRMAEAIAHGILEHYRNTKGL